MRSVAPDGRVGVGVVGGDPLVGGTHRGRERAIEARSRSALRGWGNVADAAPSFGNREHCPRARGSQCPDLLKDGLLVPEGDECRIVGGRPPVWEVAGPFMPADLLRGLLEPVDELPRSGATLWRRRLRQEPVAGPCARPSGPVERWDR